ncbi:hypothetical protein H0S56_06450 [Acinetobacter lwoffii]|uniref:phage tail fiber protein n=1 Tax=Acinetobacter lwoffii TaxID=28090 RepID=UPI00189FEB38|nr:hypothetical protein [Acinetobacter lwoffii]QPF33274.1 hypothetical protein H0S56_06450 [Acinetobacter lwoffii]
MAIQNIVIGTPGAGGGDPAYAAFTKINQNFSNQQHAASRMVGDQAGNVMEVGAFGLGGSGPTVGSINNLDDLKAATLGKTQIIRTNTGNLMNLYTPILYIKTGDTNVALNLGALDGSINMYGWVDASSDFSSRCTVRTTLNTTVDSNGFIKKASPVVQLFADRIAANKEALEQEPTFEKIDIGHYLLKNTEGFSDDGWYIEMPKDANGNVLVAVQYQQLEDNTIEVKTFAKKFDEETGDIVPNLEKPRDIPSGRWIDIRLKALPQTEIEISKTLADFQPTNLAQAVAEALKDDSEQ